MAIRPSGSQAGPRSTLNPLVMVVCFAVVGGLLLAAPWAYERPFGESAAVPPSATDPTPVRMPPNRPEIQLAGYTYRCSECHDLFPSPPETTRSLTQHRDIVLNHGINTRCFNCHHLTNRDTFVDDYGREIPYDQPPLLCAKCHGPVYRDWLHGAHGRTNGCWSPTMGPMERRKCIECHDPHDPPFPPMEPASPPETLRMGDQQFPPEHPAVTNPLRIYHQSRPSNLDRDRRGAASEQSRDRKGAVTLRIARPVLSRLRPCSASEETLVTRVYSGSRPGSNGLLTPEGTAPLQSRLCSAARLRGADDGIKEDRR